jgi:hypothetical protein
MQSSPGPTADARFCPLAPGRHVREVVDACRSAALGFAWSAHHGWGKRELARWLVGPYAHATSATRGLRGSGLQHAVAPHPLEEATIETLLVDARAEILMLLRDVWSWSYDTTSARACIDEGLVVGIADDEANLGYGPVERPRMRLVDRVRSLFVADYLTRPADYAAFAVCSGCDGATFDGGLYHEGCARPRLRSVLRRRAAVELRLPTYFDEHDALGLALKSGCRQPRWWSSITLPSGSRTKIPCAPGMNWIGPPLSAIPAAVRRSAATVISGQSSATWVMPGCFTGTSISTFGSLAFGALRIRLISSPDGCSRMATGSGPIGPAVFVKPRSA